MQRAARNATYVAGLSIQDGGDHAERCGTEREAKRGGFCGRRPPSNSVAGKPIWEPGGRKVGTLKAVSGPEPAGSDYAVICVGAYPKIGAEYRAVPNTLLAFDAERGGFICNISELALLTAPVYSAARDFMDESWRKRVGEHYRRAANSAEAGPEMALLAG